MPIHYQPTSFSSARPTSSGPAANPGGLPLNATIADRHDLHDELAILRIRLNGWELPPFQAGQYLDIAMQARSTVHQSVSLDSSAWAVNAELLRRSYSIASGPAQRREVELLLNLVPKGEFTPMLWRLDPGDRLHISPRVRGRFTLESVPQNADLVLVATGTGLAPYLSMLRDAAVNGPRWNTVTLLQSVRTVADLAYRDELAALATDPALRLTWLPTVTRAGDGEWGGLRERVTALLSAERYATLAQGRTLDPATTHVFLCGHPDMIGELSDRLVNDGFIPHRPNSPGNLHTESYW